MVIFFPTNREGFKLWIKIVGVILIALAMFFSASKIQYKSSSFVQEGAVSISEMNANDVYQLSDVVVIDIYASYDNEEDGCMYLVKFNDNDDTAKFATIFTTADDGEVFDRLFTYISDNEQGIGDCVLNASFTVTKLEDFEKDSGERSKIRQFYSEIYANYQQAYNAEVTDLIFEYACDSENDFAEYLKDVKNNNIKWGAISAALTVGGIVCLVIGFLMSKKDKKNEEERYDAIGGVYYDPNKTQAELNSENYDTQPDVTENESSEYQNAEKPPVTYTYSEPVQTYEAPKPYTQTPYQNTTVNNVEYTPKKSKVPKIIGRILSVVLLIVSGVLMIGVVGVIIDGEPEIIHSEEIDLYNINTSAVYELADIKVVPDCYYSDDYYNYYLVIYPGGDGAEKAFSLVCTNYDETLTKFNDMINASENGAISICAVFDYSMAEESENSYNKALAEYNDAQDTKLASTGHNFRFLGDLSEESYKSYVKSENTYNITMTVATIIILCVGIFLAVISFRNKKPKNYADDNNGTYYKIEQ